MYSGLLDLPWWGYVLATLGMTHVTIASITIYLHRHQAHRALDLHPALAHFFRFWLWLATGTVTGEWVAVHRKHHACVESGEDPHSPKTFGIKKLLLEGAELYREAARDRETVAKYSHGCPDDWLERNVYKPYTDRGYYLMLIIDVVLFGPSASPSGRCRWSGSRSSRPESSTVIGHWWDTGTTRRRTSPPTSCPGASSSAARSSTTTTTRSPAPEAVDQAVGVRHRVGVHPRVRAPRARQGQEATARGGDGARQARPGHRHRSRPSSPTGSRSWPIMRSA